MYIFYKCLNALKSSPEVMHLHSSSHQSYPELMQSLSQLRQHVKKVYRRKLQYPSQINEIFLFLPMYDYFFLSC